VTFYCSYAPTTDSSQAVLTFALFARGSGELFRAVGEYRLAWSIQKSVVAAECLFDGLIMQSDRAKALTVAQEALKLAGPENPRVLTLMGRALSSDPGTVDQATKYFEKALTLEPKCLEAIIALAAFYRGAEKIDKAVDLYVLPKT
jgi:tetratricopeptide (TPR) repeat protein